MSNPQTSPAAGNTAPAPATNASDKPATVKAEPKPEKAKSQPARTVLVLDTTATHESGPRKHEQIVNGAPKSFTFKPGEPLELPVEIAAKFMKQPDVFKLVNKAGEVMPYVRQPKQPEELQAGETLELAEHETIARFDELSTKSLAQRTLELPGGEMVVSEGSAPDRAAMVAFLIEATKLKRTANKAATPDVGENDFVPEAESGTRRKAIDT